MDQSQLLKCCPFLNNGLVLNSDCSELVVCSCILILSNLCFLSLVIQKVSKGDSNLRTLKLSFMIVRLVIRYLYRSLPKGYYLAQITELLGLHLSSSTPSLFEQIYLSRSFFLNLVQLFFTSFDPIRLTNKKKKARLVTQRRSEIWTSLDEWSKRGWVANGPDFQWDLKSRSLSV